MATMVNGTNMVLSVDDTTAADLAGVAVIAAATSCTLTVTTDAPEISDKGTTTAGGNDRKEFIGLSTSWTVDADVLYNEDGGVDFASLFVTAYGNATAAATGPDGPTVANYPRRVFVKFLGSTGGNYYSGAGFITSITGTGGTEDAATYSVSIQGTGTLGYDAS